MAYENFVAGKGSDYIICSPDKDLNQIPGLHYDYRSKTDPGTQENSGTIMITDPDAHWNFWTQMLTGDETDNVAGVPGLGPVIVRKIIDELKADGNMISTRKTVEACYIKYFGEYYGPLIFTETEQTLRLMSILHPMYPKYEKIWSIYTSTIRPVPVHKGFFDITS